MIKKIYKFGGASVKDADAVRNLADIVKRQASAKKNIFSDFME